MTLNDFFNFDEDIKHKIFIRCYWEKANGDLEHRFVSLYDLEYGSIKLKNFYTSMCFLNDMANNELWNFYIGNGYIKFEVAHYTPYLLRKKGSYSVAQLDLGV